MADENIAPPETTETEGNQANEIAIPAKKDLATILKEWPLSKKIALVAVCLISIAIFAVIIVQARTANFQLLYANLSPKDAGAVVTWLKGERLDYKLKNNGKDIWIPAEQLYETRLNLASSGLPAGGGVGFEIFDKQSFALTDFVQKVNYSRALQGELARTITSLEPVDATRVHLVLPEKRLFKNQQKSATASIIVTLGKGKTLEKEQVQGIIHLVSGSVEGLSSEEISVIDSKGKILEGTMPEENAQSISVDMLVFQQEIEKRLEKRAQDLLDKTMGYGQAMVRVTANLDFAKVEKTEELFDAEEPVVRSQQIQEESNGEGTGAQGIPGVQSNLQGPDATLGGATASSSKKTSSTINYEISKTISKTINPVGAIKSLSVSVLLADKVIPPKDEESSVTTQTREEDELKNVEKMVASALGLNKERGDIINVTSMAFMETEDDALLAEAMPKNLLYEYLPLVKIGLLSFATLLCYLFLIRPIIKTMKSEVTEHNKTVGELETAAREIKEAKELAAEEAREKELEEIIPDTVITLRNEVMRNHVPTAYIIKNWINEG